MFAWDNNQNWLDDKINTLRPIEVDILFYSTSAFFYSFTLYSFEFYSVIMQSNTSSKNAFEIFNGICCICSTLLSSMMAAPTWHILLYWRAKVKKLYEISRSSKFHFLIFGILASHHLEFCDISYRNRYFQCIELITETHSWLRGRTMCNCLCGYSNARHDYQKRASIWRRKQLRCDTLREDTWRYVWRKFVTRTHLSLRACSISTITLAELTLIS